jgi:Protein of unknown function (DUF3293)
VNHMPDPDVASVYLQTEVSVALPDQGWVDAAKAARLTVSKLCVITAWNPGSLRPGLEVNRSRNAQLLNRLRRLGCETHPAVGSSHDGDHREESYAVVGATRDDVLALGREFGQAAIFEITPERLTVVSCDENWARSRDLRSSDDVDADP